VKKRFSWRGEKIKKALWPGTRAGMRETCGSWGESHKEKSIVVSSEKRGTDRARKVSIAPSNRGVDQEEVKGRGKRREQIRKAPGRDMASRRAHHLRG